MGRRQPDRASDVGSNVQRSIACDRGCGRAGARAGRIAVEAPGIARDAVQAGEARRQHAVVRHRGLGEDDRAGFTQPRGGRRILLRRYKLDTGGTQRDRLALGGDIVLDGDRNAVERARGLAPLPAVGRGLRGSARGVRIEQIERLDVRLPCRDMLDHFLQHFRGRELLGAIAGDQVGRGKVMQRGDLFFGGRLMHANLPEDGFR